MKRFRELSEPFISYFQQFRATLSPVEEPYPHFWRIDLTDIKCTIAMLFVTLSIWAAVAYTGKKTSIVYYWDGPNYIYAGLTLYDITTENNPWKKYLRLPPSYFACHLPGYPLLIRFCSYFTKGDYVLADYLSILVGNFLVCYSFRRLLLVYDCVEDPTYTTLLLCIFPLRFTIYHSVGASEPLFISFVCLSLTFYKFDNWSMMILCVWGGCITRIEGMSIGAAIGICYIVQFKIFKAASMFLTFVSTAWLLLFHKTMFGSALAYLNYNKGSQNLIVFPPFIELRPARISRMNVIHYHSFIDFYFPYVIGMIVTLLMAGPVGIFGSIYLCYVSFLRHLDILRYSIPAGVFAVLIGYDKLWSNKICKSALFILLPLYFAFILSYSSGQIHSNKCSERFFREVAQLSAKNIH